MMRLGHTIAALLSAPTLACGAGSAPIDPARSPSGASMFEACNPPRRRWAPGGATSQNPDVMQTCRSLFPASE